jgi:hypothetical protein
MLLDVGQLRKTIKNGVEMKTWIYYDAAEEFGYDHESPPPAFQVSDTALLYTPEEAARLKVRIKGKWQPEPGPGQGGGGVGTVECCPVCDQPTNACICGVTGGGGKDGGKQIPALLKGQGAVLQAFGQVADQCAEHKVTHLRRLIIRAEGLNKQVAADIRGLGLAIPQFGKARYNIQQQVIAAYGPAAGGETFEVKFNGGWERYKRLRTVVEAFCTEADQLTGKMRVEAEFEHGLEVGGQQFAIMRDVLATLELGKITVEAVPAETVPTKPAPA